ncbi:M20/M25/M40 family metallo-hydrolase [Paenibacillus sp. sptzw28]|uniref:M20/M25/M40 family metallo-hydrolase n=1 Tax=Paenibacillus sp. sptzw28 TaxID=715179 RepID=UPI001C6EE200|nr:M20/M25/M40 family metallo-hydrolase [Paenibacillus sp. sptzw28]QYR23486.1 M20/M25/M40 family metallo-hydrolase [Paenibacillus sp. sptzw28]
MMKRTLFTSDHIDLLLSLLQLNTVTPMETGRPADIADAQDNYARFATERLDCEVVFHAPPIPDNLEGAVVPLSVHERADRMGSDFWACQPNLVLRLGPERPSDDTVMFNFHMDTVDGTFPVSYDGETFVGRGAADMKGPGVALLAGIEGALRNDPSWLDEFSVLIQCVSGEEGGAMGVYGTKLLAEQGWLGRLNIFAEPSGSIYFDRSTTSMTARIEVNGQDATDDAPHQGHNATLLLGYLAERLLAELSGPIEKDGGKMCLAGIHTGYMHNKVYGSGTLLLNFAYGSTDSGRTIRSLMDEAFIRLIGKFSDEFREAAAARFTAEAAAEICSLTWVKEGLPVLGNRDPEWEAFLEHIGWVRNPDDHVEQAFTCDAMWAQRPGSYTIVYGPGSLGGNLAHAEGEFIRLQELERYAGDIMTLLTGYGAHRRNQKGKEAGIRDESVV